MAGVFLSPDSVQGNASEMNPYGYVGGNPETNTDPAGQAFITDQEIASLAEGAAYFEVPAVYQNAFRDGPILDPTVAPPVSASAGDTTYTYDPTSDVMLINKPGEIVPQGYTPDAGPAFDQALGELNQLLASMGGTAVNSALLAKHGISDLLPTEGGLQTQAGGGGQGGKPPTNRPTASPPPSERGRGNLRLQYVLDNMDTIFSGYDMGTIQGTEVPIKTPMGGTDIDILTSNSLTEVAGPGHFYTDGAFDPAKGDSFITKMQKYRLFSEGTTNIFLAYDNTLLPLPTEVADKLISWGIIIVNFTYL